MPPHPEDLHTIVTIKRTIDYEIVKYEKHTIFIGRDYNRVITLIRRNHDNIIIPPSPKDIL